MEINKFIGYTELSVGGEVIPVKIGLFSLDMFCAAYPSTASTVVADVFEDLQLDDGRKSIKPKDIGKFLTIALWAGANYASKINGGRSYEIIEAYQWVDEIGFNNEQTIKFISEFYTSILNGGPIPKKSEFEAEKPKSETKKKNSPSKTSGRSR